jgi:ribosomal protein S18 acetylase RimI-like enzyme
VVTADGGSAGVVVRPARAEDAAALADILMEALGVKYRPALGPRSRDALEAVIVREVETGASGYVVAEAGGALVGAAHLAVAEDPRPDGVTRAMADVVGRRRAMWASVVLSLLAHGPLARDEAYIGELGVRARARRSGVARRLLTHLEQTARELGKRRLTLWVTVDNDPALALYRGAGFREVDRRRWLLGGVLFGSRGAVLMEKTLTGVT